MSRHGLPALVRSYRSAADAGENLVLATVVGTQGSTYRKAGGRMLIGADGVRAGILGGGCFDRDLADQAQGVLTDGRPRTVTYDMRSSDEAIWGLGLGCEGAVDIFLQRQAGNDDDEMALIDHILRGASDGRLATVIGPEGSHLLGKSWIVGQSSVVPIPGTATGRIEAGGSVLFVDVIRQPLHLVICGAGVDAVPLAQAASQLGWRVSVLDHRPGYLRPDRIPQADELVLFRDSLPESLSGADAVVVMSHDLTTDERYLKAVAAASPIPYVGLLGPTGRRRRLLDAMGATGDPLADRLRAPVGLDLGGELPEEIALAIVAEIQMDHYDRTGAALTGAGVK